MAPQRSCVADVSAWCLERVIRQGEAGVPGGRWSSARTPPVILRWSAMSHTGPTTAEGSPGLLRAGHEERAGADSVAIPALGYTLGGRQGLDTSKFSDYSQRNERRHSAGS